MSQSSSDDEDANGGPTKKMKYSSSPENKTLVEDVEKVENEEKVLSGLFNRVFKFVQDYFSVNDELIEESIHEIRSKFNTFDYLKTDFSKIENLCAYFYSHSTLNAALVRSRILDVLNKCEEINEKISESEINIVSLGGGPGTDILGFCSALQEYTAEENGKKIFNITAVDNVKRWSSFSYYMYFIILEGDYGNVSTFFKKHDVFPNFMCIDLFSKTVPSKYKNDIKQADIVLLSRVLDAQKWNEKDPNNVLKILIPNMKKDALLLIIDCFSMEYETNGLKMVYKAELPEFQLTFDQEQRFTTSSSSKATIRVYKKKSRKK